LSLRPLYTSVDAIPAEELEARKAALLADETTARKPENVRAQIIDGQLKKWYAEVVLVEQPFRDEDRTVGALITEAIAKTGENIKVRRFVRFELGA
jgi:elongation factor Ts